MPFQELWPLDYTLLKGRNILRVILHPPAMFFDLYPQYLHLPVCASLSDRSKYLHHYIFLSVVSIPASLLLHVIIS